MMLLKQLVTLTKDYKAEYADKDKEERPKSVICSRPSLVCYLHPDVDSIPRKVI